MQRFDVIIVGAGPAGSTAGLLLARAGLSVLIVERGQVAGQKNVSGGILYSALVNEILPNFMEKAPLERAITNHQLVILSDHRSVSLEFRNEEASQNVYPSFSVLRAKFDPWLASQAEEAGAMLITGVTVDSLWMKDGKVIGIQAGPDQLEADVVMIAEGTKSLLLKQAGLREEFYPRDVSLGVKEIISLPEQVIEERFQCSPTTGTAYTLLGHTLGIEGGGFIYTNRDTLSVGVVVKIESLYKNNTQPHQVLDEFKSHPLVKRLTLGGDIVEYSAQTVHRGGFHLLSRLYGDGFVVIGSAARLLFNNIFALRGMDFAIASASAAAKAILSAKEKGSYSSNELSVYADLLKQSSIYKDWSTFKNTYSLLENKRLFNNYPDIITETLESLFKPTTKPTPKLMETLRMELKNKVSFVDLMADIYQISRGFIL
jgi:electron transfer flavoprotein-quinone oxidoreductase